MKSFKKNRWMRKFSDHGHLYQHEKTGDSPIVSMTKGPVKEEYNVFDLFKMSETQPTNNYAN